MCGDHQVEGTSPEDPVTIQHPTADVTLVGVRDDTAATTEQLTAHVDETDPATVAVGLDNTRYTQLEHADEAIAPSDVMSGKTGYQFLGYWLSAAVREAVTDDYSNPGSELQALTTAVTEQSSKPIDRDIGTTAQRLWATMGAVTKASIVTSLTARLAGGPGRAAAGIGMFQGLLFGAIIGLFLGPVFVPPGTGAAVPLVGGAIARTLDTVALILGLGVAFTIPLYGLLRAGTGRFASKQPATVGGVDVLTDVIDAFAGSQETAATIHDQRAAYMAYRLEELTDDGTVLAVVDHRMVAPVVTALQAPDSRLPRDAITGPVPTSRLRSGLYKAIGYGFTVGFLVLLVLLALGSVQETVLLSLFGAWFLINFVAAAGTAYVLGAHWKSATAGGLVAWFTSINPTITPGLFIAYVELRYRTVRLSDLAQIKANLRGEDNLRTRINRLRADNGLFHILFVITFANLISFFAGVAFVAALLPVFGADIGGFDDLGEALVTSIAEGIAVVEELVRL